jgi:hypothetical protein
MRWGWEGKKSYIEGAEEGTESTEEMARNRFYDAF